MYLAFLVTSPFEHHDLACHDRTPFHCPTCASSQPGADPQTPVGLSAFHLADAGRAVASLIVLESAVLPVRSTGRSPPSVA